MRTEALIGGNMSLLSSYAESILKSTPYPGQAKGGRQTPQGRVLESPLIPLWKRGKTAMAPLSRYSRHITPIDNGYILMITGIYNSNETPLNDPSVDLC